MSEEKFAVGGRRSRFDEYVRSQLTEKERQALDAAMDEEGLEHEVALLRLKLLTAMRKDDVDLKAVRTLAGMLVRAVGTQHRMSPGSRKNLADGIAFVLGDIGDHLLPPGR